MRKRLLLITMFILVVAAADVLGGKLLQMSRSLGHRSKRRGGGV